MRDKRLVHLMVIGSLLIGVICGTAVHPSSCLASSYPEGKSGWNLAKEIVQRIKEPRFPNRNFNVCQFGAVGDGKTDCTRGFAEAIMECYRAGGGRVVVPPGTYVCGPIHLRSGVNLHLERSAIIVFTTNVAAYLPVVFSRFEGVEVMNYSPLVYARGQSNIALTGKGILDARDFAKVVHPWAREARVDIERLAQMAADGVPVEQRVFGQGHKLRQNFFQPMNCINVLVEGVTFLGSPMWTLNPIYCTNVIIRGVTVITEGPNTDGCNPDSCYDILIEDCWFSNGDDCIAIKSGRDHDGRRVNVPSQNVVIRRCRFANGHGGVALGSETAGGIANVFVEDCYFESPDLRMALRWKTNPARGGYITNVYFRNCHVKCARFGIHMTMRYAASGAKEGDHMPIVSDAYIENCRFETLLERPVFIEGHSERGKISRVVIRDCKFGVAPKPGLITNATAVQIIGCKNLQLE